MGKQSRRKREARQALAASTDAKPVEMTCTSCGRETNDAEVSANGGCPGCGADTFQIGEPKFFGDWAR